MTEKQNKYILLDTILNGLYMKSIISYDDSIGEHYTSYVFNKDDTFDSIDDLIGRLKNIIKTLEKLK
jgi:hypothetical protein